jgi:hypothetical protein
MAKLTIDFETADRLTLVNLKEALKYNVEENDAIKEKYLLDDMPDYKLEDFQYNKKLIKALKRVISYYGG